ncbi:trypsin-like serine protease [Bdellovibrio bacteriovorus]|uniref:S1 family peptidase n=1 Tax=Bdellovibrio bacteriovorus TaxID=959 RepID=UPI0035A6F848
MKTKLYVSSFIVLILSACGGYEAAYSPAPNDTAIVGGTMTAKDNIISQYVVLIYDNPTKTYCTGALISKRLILTAAHCVGKGAEGLTLAFGLNPLAGQYVMKKAHKVATHDKYKKLNSTERNDIALISMKEDAPASYRPLTLPDSKFPLSKDLIFTAAGYGRISGKKTSADDTQGSGKLRHVDLTISHFSSDETQFYINQEDGKGICNGDSGGPALMRYSGKDYVVGVASAISWTVPGEVKASQKSQYIDNKDLCKDKSIYMNVIKYRQWIDDNSKKLL